MKNFLLIFFSKVKREAFESVKKFLVEHENEILSMSPYQIDEIYSFLDRKIATIEKWYNRDAKIDIMTFKMIANKRAAISKYTYQEISNINNLDTMLIAELSYLLSENEKLFLLSKFGCELSSYAIQSFIITLSLENQKNMISKFKSKIVLTDFNDVLSFLGVLEFKAQQRFLKVTKEFVTNLDEKEFTNLSVYLRDESLETLFIEYKDKIEGLSVQCFADFLSTLSGNSILLFEKHFKTKYESIPSDAFMYLLETSLDDKEAIYDFWKRNPQKLKELSNNYFTLLISRLPNELRKSSIVDFKVRYDKMEPSTLLDLFSYDTPEINELIFKEYKHRIILLDGNIFIKYIFDIESFVVQRSIASIYSDYIYGFSDEVFIPFIDKFIDKNIGYRQNEKEAIEILRQNGFLARIKDIEIEFLPEFFGRLHSYLQKAFLGELSDKIKKLIVDKKFLSEFLGSLWGKTKDEVFVIFKEQFKLLSAKEWYELLTALNGVDLETLEDFLLYCPIDTLDFIDRRNQIYRDLFYYFEENIRINKEREFQELIEKGQGEELLSTAIDLLNLIDFENADVLINYECISLAVCFKVLLKNKIIDTQNEYYIRFREAYMASVISKLEKEEEADSDISINSLFRRIVNGSVSASMLLYLDDFKGLIFYSRNVITYEPGGIKEFTPYEATSFAGYLNEAQVQNINYNLLSKIEEHIIEVYGNKILRESIRYLSLKLFLSVGFSNAKKIIDLKHSFTELEYVFNGIDLKRIKIDDRGEPILNVHLIDFLFGSRDTFENSNMAKIVEKEDEKFTNLFSVFYNQWNVLYSTLNGVVTKERILKYFENYNILLNPDEYKLSPVIKELGNNRTIIDRARGLYTEMKNRKFSTIPKVSGNVEDYTYEVLDLDDPLGIVVGYIVYCCFLIDGLSRTSLFHALTNKDGRIFAVNKDGKLVVHSWIWRNGNLVCFDNVEADKCNINILTKIYEEASLKILEVSQNTESPKERVKLVTVGVSETKIKLPKESVEDVRRPRVSEYIYTDASSQRVLASSKERELYYGDVSAEYKDPRREILRVTDLELLDEKTKLTIFNKVAAIYFVKYGESRLVEFDQYAYAAIQDDWYLLIGYNGEAECEIMTTDNRAREELYKEVSNLDKYFKENSLDISSLKIKEKVNALLSKGGK